MVKFKGYRGTVKGIYVEERRIGIIFVIYSMNGLLMYYNFLILFYSIERRKVNLMSYLL